MIVIKNVIFNKSKLYLKVLKQLNSYSVMIIRQVIELIEEEDIIQNAGSIIEYIALIDRELIKNIVSPFTLILKGELLSKTIES